MIEEKAYAKLNLSLDVTERREDGYHNMVMVMQTASVFDRVSVALNDSGRVSAQTNLHYIPSDERNLAVKTVIAYLTATGRGGQGVSVRIKKNIPVGAGMAGGSADAAAVLRAMNGLYKDGMTHKELEALAEKIGSDVAFCVAGGTSLAEGRGEVLTPLKPMPDCFFLICKPNFSVSTPELFAKLDKQRMRSHPDTAGMLEAIESGELRQICRRLYNVFEDVDDRRFKIVADIKSHMIDSGAEGAAMTGTGSAVFGIYEDETAAAAACAELRKDFGFCQIARPQPRML